MGAAHMNEVVELDECRDEICDGRYPSRLRVGKSNGGGGGMDDVLKRLGVVESTVSEIRSQVSGIATILPHLATKDDVTAVRVEVSELRAEVRNIAAVMPHLATKADLSEEIGGAKVEIGSLRTDLCERIGSVRTDLGAQIGSVRADLGAQIGSVRADLGTQIGTVRADLGTQIGTVRTDLCAQIGSVRTDLGAQIGSLETKLIKWGIATGIALTGLVFTIVKFVH
jgi:hypothetical protein